VFDAGAFSAKALVHNLRDSDYGRCLSDLRAAFYSAPRLPLLYAGDRDLQQAIYDAVAAGTVQIVDGAGEPVAVTAPNQVNLASAGLRLAKPPVEHPTTPAPGPDGGQVGIAGPGGLFGTGEGTGGPAGVTGGTGPTGQESATEQQVLFSFTKNLLGDAQGADDLADLFKALYQALDERQISYGQGTLQLIVVGDVADNLTEKLSALGVNATIKPV
jgi:hypothetical protein